jgi:uncharacterized protein (DUF488 family)
VGDRVLDTASGLLQEYGIRVRVDARRLAGSGRNPQCSGESMAHSLPASGFACAPMPDLGGRRTAREGAPHTAWRNARFRGFADYMDTDACAAAQAVGDSRARAAHCGDARGGKRRQAFGGTSCSRRPFSSSVTT